MKSLFIYLFFLFASLTATAQNLDYIKSEDTLYLVLPALHPTKPSYQEFDKFSLSISSNGIMTEYFFSDKDSTNHVILIDVVLSNHKPKDELPITVKRKQFIKKHKNQILGLDVISKYRNEEFFFGYLGARAAAPSSKVIYIIDEESLKRKDKRIQLMRSSLITLGYSRI